MDQTTHPLDAGTRVHDVTGRAGTVVKVDTLVGVNRHVRFDGEYYTRCVPSWQLEPTRVGNGA